MGCPSKNVVDPSKNLGNDLTVKTHISLVPTVSICAIVVHTTQRLTKTPRLKFSASDGRRSTAMAKATRRDGTQYSSPSRSLRLGPVERSRETSELHKSDSRYSRFIDDFVSGHTMYVS